MKLNWFCIVMIVWLNVIERVFINMKNILVIFNKKYMVNVDYLLDLDKDEILFK